MNYIFFLKINSHITCITSGCAHTRVGSKWISTIRAYIAINTRSLRWRFFLKKRGTVKNIIFIFCTDQYKLKLSKGKESYDTNMNSNWPSRFFFLSRCLNYYKNRRSKRKRLYLCKWLNVNNAGILVFNYKKTKKSKSCWNTS